MEIGTHDRVSDEINTMVKYLNRPYFYF